MDKKNGTPTISVRVRKTKETEQWKNRQNTLPDFVDILPHLENNIAMEIVPDVIESIGNYGWSANFSETERSDGYYDCFIKANNEQDCKTIENIIKRKFHIIPVRYFEYERR